MKALFVIPHYFRPVGHAADGRTHGSVRRNPEARVAALTDCLTAILDVCEPRVCVLSHVQTQARVLPPSEPIETAIVVCTSGNDHLLDSLAQAVSRWTHNPTDASPPLLGYECHAVMRDRLGEFDYYCFLEDDIALTDPWMFRKLDWFRRKFGDTRLLQPNRFESGNRALVDKIYVDGDLPAHCTADFQLPANPDVLSAEVLDRPVVFRSTTNPHAGCFFLTTAQMETWVRTPYFLDRSTRFIGPLESAATLGVMRTFEVFKPGLENADFLEVRHYGTSYLEMIDGNT